MLPGNYPSGRGGQLDLHSTTVDGVGVSRVGLVPHFRQASAQAGRMEAGSPVPSGPAGEKAAPPSPAYRAPDAPTDNAAPPRAMPRPRSEEHTSELQSLMRISYAVFSLKKKT